MQDRPIAYDLSRLVTRLAHATPTGIDRVDLAYARWLFATGQRFGLISTPAGPRVMRRGSAAAILAALHDRWSEDGAPEQDPLYRDVTARLGLRTKAPGASAVPPPGRAAGPGPFRLRATALAGSRGPGCLPAGTAYVHTSHLRLDRPERFAWLAARPDVDAVFFVHDLIPIDHPEFSRPGEDARHAVRLDTIARYGRRAIVNSAEVGRALGAHWARTGRAALPISVAPLGVEPAFLTRPDDTAGGDPFFLVCGTIEPRKNHAFLLQLWRRMAEDGGPVPKLVIAGRRGWESETVIDVLERAPFVRRHVIEVAGLSTPALAGLMARARALLMPSFAEGYGLPVAEALSLGTPVVASDIPVHREVAGGHALLLDPLDGPAWLRAVRLLAATPAPPRAAGGPPYRPPTWEAHFAIAAAALAARGAPDGP